MAEECFKWASEAVDDDVRAGYLGLAQIWPISLMVYLRPE